MMNLDYLNLFVRVAATNNISKAGAELGLSSAVASAHLNKLEESIGVRLIHRTTRKVSLTDEGKEFLPHAKDVLVTADIALTSVKSERAKIAGKLRITAPVSFGHIHLIPALNKFMDLYPDLTVELRLSDTIVDMVEGGFDIAIRNAELKDSTLVARKLATDNRIICASPDYLNKHGIPTNPEALLQHNCINLIGNEHWHFKTPSGSKTVKTKGSFASDNGEAVRNAGINGMGVIMCSTWIAYEQLKAGQLVQILRDYPLESHASIWAVYPSSKLVAPKVRAFIDFFSASYGSPPYWDKVLESQKGQ
ncbi:MULTISPECIES: LysR family transcriptional regulator [unclassified Pseudoalteromonas]|uniref:LysR family transcriptional regulator n=1 Tax=unclassified Pseudoalteromonas TaxID=194690 RepID=UPI00257B1698|nr:MULTISPECIES: LysR family transcriptional regulator [unclassified Pseudoalteromonas]|tara:strand:+ start:161 stop:1081 length:921 start_codon:yes stop_codon:yes gene_type:complete